MVASVLFSIAPVFHFMRPDLVNSLRQNTGTLSKESQRFRKLAVGAQIALSVMLLGGAGLFVRTLDNLRQQQVGFEIGNLVTLRSTPRVRDTETSACPDRQRRARDAGQLFRA